MAWCSQPYLAIMQADRYQTTPSCDPMLRKASLTPRFSSFSALATRSIPFTMPESRPTIVFIPGAWHSVTSFDVLKAQLEAWSYSCTGADPPSVTSKHPLDVTLDTDVDFYRENVILPLLNDGKTIVLLQHSYGGVPGSGAVEGLSKREREKAGQKGGVLGLIFMTAVCLPVGQSIQDFIGLDDDFTPWTDVQVSIKTHCCPAQVKENC